MARRAGIPQALRQRRLANPASCQHGQVRTLTVLSPDVPEQMHVVTDGNLREESNYVLNELIIALMRKGVLTEAEGKAMLKKLLQ